MSTSVSIVYRKDKKNRLNLAPIYIRFIKNRKINYVATGIKIESTHWDEKNHRVKSSYPNSARANAFLNKLLYEYQDRVLKEETSNIRISAKDLKEKVTGPESAFFFSVAEGLLKKYKSKKSIGTHDKTKSILGKLQRYGGKMLKFEDITPRFLRDYETYLRDTLNNKTNTVHKDMKFIRRVFNEAYALELIDHSLIPFNKYKLKTEKTVRVYLSEYELNRLNSIDTSKGLKLELHRDVFVFSAYTGGLRVSDILLLRKTNFDGTHLSIQIQKTRSQLSVKVPDKALLIIRKYQSGRSAEDPFLFPILPEDLDLKDPVEVDREITRGTAYINKNLKLMAKLAHIEKNISMHTARHSWATLALKKGISIDKVSKLMGHAAIRETQLYAKIVNQDLDNAMDVFNT